MTAKALTVKELRKILADIPDDTLVVLSGDSEGNEFSPLCGFSSGVYQPGHKPWQKGHFYDEAEAPPESREAGKLSRCGRCIERVLMIDSTLTI